MLEVLRCVLKDIGLSRKDSILPILLLVVVFPTFGTLDGSLILILNSFSKSVLMVSVVFLVEKDLLFL